MMTTAREMWVDGVRGILAMQQAMPGVMTVRELQSMLDLGWASTPATGITIDDLHARKPWGPEQVHPKRLLEELAEEFDRGISA